MPIVPLMVKENLVKHQKVQNIMKLIVDDDGNIIDYLANSNNSNRKQWHKRCWNNCSIKKSKKHLKCLWLIAKLLFNWHVLKKSILVAGTAAIQVPKFWITNTTLYVPAIIWSTQENIKLLKQLESGFKRIINQNKYYSEKTNQTQKK